MSTLREIRQRLSLRDPQTEALNRLAAVVEKLDLQPRQPHDPARDLQADLATVQGLYPSVESFERDFPNLCFALATGVGKTRLMGAMIAWLTITGRSRNFFVLAPNLTIYEKLKEDFTPHSPKYVFAGLRQFASRAPIVVTGETWDTGRGVRDRTDMFGDNALPCINIFNVGKINKETGRMQRLHEYVGESYFDYLAGLSDLVLFMDEAHRYRAKAAMKAVNELTPMLGVELTATPKTTGANPKDFKNVAYDYPLAHALRDGFVKEPAVATRADFDPASVSAEALDRIKLEDGIHCHEQVKIQLQLYAAEQNLPLVHPFMLVVAKDTAHAGQIKRVIQSNDFFDGRYAETVIEVHSNLRGDESEEAISRLVAVQDDASTEIVIHVNKLKEGWDVNNLYTIVPLRASDSEILTEQTIGRGLRLPYGRRTGDAAVDRLTIVAHDQFQKIIDRASQPDSLIKETRLVGPGGNVSTEREAVVHVPPTVVTYTTGRRAEIDGTPWEGVAEPDPPPYGASQAPIAAAALEGISAFTGLPSSAELQKDEVIAALTEHALAQTAPAQMDGIDNIDQAGQHDAARQTVKQVIEQFCKSNLDIPNVLIRPDGQVHYGFNDFDMGGLNQVNVQPVERAVLVEELSTRKRSTFLAARGAHREERPADYLIAQLYEHPEIDYDAHAGLLYKLAGQVIDRLHSYLPDEDDVDNAAAYHAKQLAELIWQQMRQHKWHTAVTYTATVESGFIKLKDLPFSCKLGQATHPLLEPVTDKSKVRQLLFSGFERCCYAIQKFDSVEGEVTFARLIDRDEAVLRWLKPAPRQFMISYGSGQHYNPDFAVECKDVKLIVETKKRSELENATVLEKARSAAQWCVYASDHANQHGGKPWKLLVIPHDAFDARHTLAGLIARYEFTAQENAQTH